MHAPHLYGGDNLDSIDKILQAEKTAEEIKRAGREQAASIIAEAEKYRDEAMTKAQQLGSETADGIIKEARAEADARAAELARKAAAEISDMREKAAENLDKAAAYIAQSIIKD